MEFQHKKTKKNWYQGLKVVLLHIILILQKKEIDKWRKLMT